MFRDGGFAFDGFRLITLAFHDGHFGDTATILHLYHLLDHLHTADFFHLAHPLNFADMRHFRHAIDLHDALLDIDGVAAPVADIANAVGMQHFRIARHTAAPDRKVDVKAASLRFKTTEQNFIPMQQPERFIAVMQGEVHFILRGGQAFLSAVDRVVCGVELVMKIGGAGFGVMEAGAIGGD